MRNYKKKNQNQNQKIKDLINTLQKKILNDDQDSFHQDSLNYNTMKTFGPGYNGGRKSSFMKHFKTIKISDKKRGSQANTDANNLFITKFFKKIKNNIERSLDKTKKGDNKIKESSFSSSSNEEESENNIHNLSNSNDISPKKNNNIIGIINGKWNNLFAQNFIKQQTLFGNKFLRFGEKKDNNENLYENSLLKSLSPKNIVNSLQKSFINDVINEVDEEKQENLSRRNSQIMNSFRSYSKIMKNFLNNTNQETINPNNKNNYTKKSKFQKSNSSNDLISEDKSLYDKSDYEKTLRLGSINELDNEIETNKNNKLKINIEDKKYISKSSKNVKKNEWKRKRNNNSKWK